MIVLDRKRDANDLVGLAEQKRLRFGEAGTVAAATPEFWTALQSTTLSHDGRSLTLPDGWTWGRTLGRVLYVRKCYEQIAARFLDDSDPAKPGTWISRDLH